MGTKCGDGGIWTPNQSVMSRLLWPLSYIPKSGAKYQNRTDARPSSQGTIGISYAVLPITLTLHGIEGGTRTLTPSLATDFLTTMTFATISVCSLDFTLTIACALGSCRQASTPSSFDAWLGIRILHPSPTLTSYIWKVSQSKLKFLQVRCVCHSTTPT